MATHTRLKDFEKKRMLGKGSMGTVWHVRRASDKKRCRAAACALTSCSYAMKEVSMVNCNTKEKEDALNEVRLLSSITHPQVRCWFALCSRLFIDRQVLRVVRGVQQAVHRDRISAGRRPVPEAPAQPEAAGELARRDGVVDHDPGGGGPQVSARA